MILPQRQQELERLVAKLGLHKRESLRWDLLDRALSHPSAQVGQDYEQLEFLGDAVLRLAVAEFLTETYGELSVGDLAALRSVLVSDRVLAEIAASYTLDRYILKGASVQGGSQKHGLKAKARRLEEALEALLGALYVSQPGFSLIRPWLDPHWQKRSATVLADPARQNYKAALQEWTQRQYQALPDYRVQEQKPYSDPNDRFYAEVWFRGQCLGTGRGRSIKQAEQTAAQIAVLNHLNSGSMAEGLTPNPN